MIFNKTTIAALIALSVTSTANAKVVVGVNEGWELSVDGQINQFLIMTDDKNNDDFNEIRNGVLGSVLGFSITGPETDNLKINAHISFSPSTNGSSYTNLEHREVYFTIDGDFGRILAGKALGLYGSHNLQTEQTSMGTGYGTGNNANGTLGGIGFGYDYASWRSQFQWSSNNYNGFNLSLAMVDNGGGARRLHNKLPTGGIETGKRDSEDLRYEADLTYKANFQGVEFMLWLSGMNTGNNIANGADAPNGESALTTGATVNVSSFEFMAQYSDADGSLDAKPQKEVKSKKVKWDQYVLQAGYRFNRKTLVSANYSKIQENTLGIADNADTAERWTFGVYHDMNKNLRLVAEYTNIQHEDPRKLDERVFSLGGQIHW